MKTEAKGIRYVKPQEEIDFDFTLIAHLMENHYRSSRLDQLGLRYCCDDNLVQRAKALFSEPNFYVELAVLEDEEDGDEVIGVIMGNIVNSIFDAHQEVGNIFLLHVDREFQESVAVRLMRGFEEWAILTHGCSLINCQSFDHDSDGFLHSLGFRRSVSVFSKTPFDVGGIK